MGLKWHISPDGLNRCLLNIPFKSNRIAFWSAHETFSKADHKLGHKTNLNKFKSTEIILSTFYGLQYYEILN